MKNTMLLGFGLALAACGSGDKAITSEDSGTTSSNDTNDSDTNNSDTDAPEEEIVVLEPAAVGFELYAVWDEANDLLTGWMGQDSSGVPTYQEPYVKLTIANIEFFSEGAGDANENVCELYADFIHQSDVIPAHYYDWDNPPGTGEQIAPWTSYHGYLLLTGYNPNTSCENIDDGFSFVLDSAAQTMSSVFHSMHFGISFGDLSPYFEDTYPDWYANWYQGDTDADGEDDSTQLWNARKDSYFTHYISVNHPAQNEAGYDFLGYDWNSAPFFGVDEDGTTLTEPCFNDATSECYVFEDAATPGARYGFTMGDAYWYEDYPNLDFNILGDGAPAIDVDTEDTEDDGDNGDGDNGDGDNGDGDNGDGDGGDTGGN